ncbi:MAG: DsbE family thiol:disulfide interchange protein [Proteobacteria bacterium]|nr:DsbE family thiol:disulfide interchange protein [Pseudomonadota bacterium]
MNRFLLPLGVFALLAVVLAVGIRHSPDKGLIRSPLIGKPAPQFSLPDLQDPARTVQSAALQGRWYLLNVWGTWCAACRAEHEALLSIAHGRQIGIIGLNWRDTDADARQWLKQLGDPYEHVAVDRDGRTAIDWGVYGAPETFLVNPRGIVVYKHIGELTTQTFNAEILPRVRGGQGS